MSMLRSIATRTLLRSRAAAARAPKSGFQPQQWQQAARGYASKAGDAVQKNVGSDLPWLLGAIVVTVPGTYLILQTGSKPSGHGDHGDHGHGAEEHEEHEEEHEEGGEEEKTEEDAGEDKAEESKDKEEKSDESEAKDDSKEDATGVSKERKQKSTESSNEGKNMPEQPSDNTISKKTADGEEGAAFDEEHELGKDEHGNKVIHKPDAKGGAKRRIESKNAISLGDSPPEEAQGTHDKPAASKEPEEGKMSQKQAGLSNTDTKHSTDPVADGKSVKSEGAPETAKIQGTVDPSRPAK